MMDLFRSLADEGRTVVCIHHFPRTPASVRPPRLLKDGLRVFDGTPTEMKVFFGLTRIADVFGRMGERSAAKWQRRSTRTFASGSKPYPFDPIHRTRDPVLLPSDLPNICKCPVN